MNNFVQFYQLVDYVHCKEAVGNLFPFWDQLFVITAVPLETVQQKKFFPAGKNVSDFPRALKVT